MRKTFLFCTVCTLGFASTSMAGEASKEGKFYGALKGEVVFTEDSDFSDPGLGVAGSIEYEPSLGIGGAVGYRFNDFFRGELEMNYRHREIDQINTNIGTFTGDLEFNTLDTMANAYVDGDFFDIPVVPYIGAGVGSSFKTSGDSDTAFAYQAMAGVNVKIGEKSEIFSGYRYVGTTEFGDNLDAELNSHIIEAGYRHYF